MDLPKVFQVDISHTDFDSYSTLTFIVVGVDNNLAAVRAVLHAHTMIKPPHYNTITVEQRENNEFDSEVIGVYQIGGELE
jgi:hypothetical protein